MNEEEKLASNEYRSCQGHIATSSESGRLSSPQICGPDIVEEKSVHRTMSTTNVTSPGAAISKSQSPSANIENSVEKVSGISSDSSVTVLKEEPKVGNKSPTVSSQRMNKSSVTNSEVSTAYSKHFGEGHGRTSLSISPRLPRRPVTPSTEIATPPPDIDLSVKERHTKEPFTQSSQRLPRGSDLYPVKARANSEVNASTETDSSYSSPCDARHTYVSYEEMPGFSVEDTSEVSTFREKLLYSYSEEGEADVLEMDEMPPKKKQNSGEVEDKLKLNVPSVTASANAEELPAAQTKSSEHQEESQSRDVHIAMHSVEPHDSLEEIDLNEDSVSYEDDTIKSCALSNNEKAPNDEIHKGRRFAASFLKHHVIKGVVAKGTRLKEVVNEKLSTEKQAMAVTEANSAIHVVNNMSPCRIMSNYTDAAVKLQNMTQFLKTSEKTLTSGQGFIRDIASACRIHSRSAESTTAVTEVVKSVNQVLQSKDPNFRPPVPPRLFLQSESNDLSKYTTGRMETPGSFVHSTINQSPGPLRGYTVPFPPSYGIPVPPSLPPPPSVPVEDYFASRFCPSLCSSTAAAQPLDPSSPGIRDFDFRQETRPPNLGYRFVFMRDTYRDQVRIFIFFQLYSQ